MADGRRRSRNWPYVVILILGAIIIGLLLYIVPFRYGLNASVDYTPSDAPLNNPLTGYAPLAENVEECADSQLVYIELRWADWEPTMDSFDTAYLEQTYHIERWKDEGKSAVLRFVCDVPGKGQHMDIPSWLYARTQDGSYYDCEYGKGYSPNYANSLFVERHAVAIRALADYFNQDDFLAYVEVGSLGHWGEWHTDVDGGAQPMPDEDICDEYLQHYSDSFQGALLLSRRNYAIAAENDMGLYNDMIGDLEETEEWLSWLQDGGSQTTSGRPLDYTPVERFWETAPVGGEMTSGRSMEEMLGRWMNDTMETVERSHVSFIGPKCPKGELKDSEAAQTLRERLGYRLYISHLETAYSFSEGNLEVYMTWCNEGLAPVYWDWQVSMHVYDNDGEMTYWETLDIDLRDLVPGEHIETKAHIPFTDKFREGFQIGIEIDSPDVNRNIWLAMDSEIRDKTQIIYTFES